MSAATLSGKYRHVVAALKKSHGGAIEAWEVCADVGNVRNNRPEWWSGWGCRDWLMV